ncbi:MAG: hypothetical protein ACI4DQ_02170 [Lachnospiraceae bacterium]
MFQYLSPQFIHKAILKKQMLDELRDYPRVISQMLMAEHGNGIIRGTGISWDNERLSIAPGLLVHRGNIYRMETEYRLRCSFVDRLTYLKVRFMTSTGEKGLSGSIGEIYYDEYPAEREEIELGRFRLQEGARLRTEYESVEDYQTEFDTLNRIHMPWVCPGGIGLWPKLLLDYGKELLNTGTDNPVDISLAMQLLGNHGEVSGELLLWYIKKITGESFQEADNGKVYSRLLRILRGRKNGQKELGEKERKTKQMLLI